MDTAARIREIEERGYCVLRAHLPRRAIDDCRDAFWPILTAYLEAHRHEPNRGRHRHYLAMPFDRPCYATEFFFDPVILSIVRGAMDDRVVADQWGCDVPLRGSTYQELHADYRRPLFEEAPDLQLPTYLLTVSFSLAPIAAENGPMEIAPGTHRIPRAEAMRAVECGEIGLDPVTLEVGDVLIRHPWALHRGTPNLTDAPRAVATVRYVRRWYVDDSREVRPIRREMWASMSAAEQRMMRFPIE